ncbi:MAG: PIG-L family deacetylase [Saprospiraceae bacterium]
MYRNTFFYSIVVFLTILLSVGATGAQAPRKYSSAEIYEAVKKLNFLGSALYVAAHPDDENTRMIAYLSNEVKATTAYLSLTRGDGGQNLIGPEIEELLGLIRTQELLAARRVDGGKQLFTRANDFGFSKHPDETLKIWSKQEVLADVVWAFRKWQPDVVINRFDHRSPGATHGHHTSSALLSLEACDLAGTSTAFPEQLAFFGPWAPKRVFFNTSWFFYGSQEAFEKADKSNLVRLDVGGFYPALGKSLGEIAAESRSMHKCQGFGSAGVRGSERDYLELLRGDMPRDSSNIFEGINTTWTRVPGGAPIGKLLEKVEREFQLPNPAASVPDLVKAYRLMEQLPDGFWKRTKMEEIREVIRACLGLYIEVTATEPSAAPGDPITLRTEVVQRLGAPVRIEQISYSPFKTDTALAQPLRVNQRLTWNTRSVLPDASATSNPYWLSEQHSLGLYTVNDQQLRGVPETPRPLKAVFAFVVEGVPIAFETDVVYKFTDPVKGEVYQPFEVTPPVYVKLERKVFVFPDGQAQRVSVTVKAGKGNVSGELRLEVPTGWKSEPALQNFEVKRKGEDAVFQFVLTPPAEKSDGAITPVATVGGRAYRQSLIRINYDHIPVQTVFEDAQGRAVRIELEKSGNSIAYLEGAGDDIPASLRAMGYEVALIPDGALANTDLSRFDAVVTGIRAYNTREDLRFGQSKLLGYVNAGGTLLIQYNTSGGLRVPVAEIGPYSLSLSRERVTVEEAEMRFLKPDHPLLNVPNKITPADFDGWVQERGLYFPGQWDSRYEALLSCNDPGEPARDGALLYAPYGKGHFVYTGLAFFRQLPAGVPGAYRLFANIISAGKSPKP